MIGGVSKIVKEKAHEIVKDTKPQPELTMYSMMPDTDVQIPHLTDICKKRLEILRIIDDQ